MKLFLYRTLCGFFLGLSVFAPGFSGSIIAIIMGIYQDIINIAANPFKKFKENIIFCIPLVIGVLFSAIIFILTFKFLFTHYEKATYLLFVGLIAGNLPVIIKEIKKHYWQNWQKKYLIGGMITFFIALFLSIIATTINDNQGIHNISLLMLMISGFLGGSVAFIPGMSVSMVLIILGVYHELISRAELLLRFDIRYLGFFIIFTLFACLGIIITSNGIKYVFEKYYTLANVLVLGFMSGSLLGILFKTTQMNNINFNWMLGIVMLCLGLAISATFILLANINKKY